MPISVLFRKASSKDSVMGGISAVLLSDPIASKFYQLMARVLRIFQKLLKTCGFIPVKSA
jgi:hypothetical protein